MMMTMMMVVDVFLVFMCLPSLPPMGLSEHSDQAKQTVGILSWVLVKKLVLIHVAKFWESLVCHLLKIWCYYPDDFYLRHLRKNLYYVFYGF